MYEDHFGLKSRPFGAKAEGKAVFVGPTQSKTVTALHKGLSIPDAVVTVTGPVGVGKTTIVTRSLESIPDNRMVAWIGRMKLSPDELLELVLAGFGIGGKVKGTVRKIAAFRRIQRERAASGPRVAIVVEDARRLGVDALVELEALTAADSGDESSANIILMGQPDLHEFLQDSDLARMMQRRRNRLQIEPLTVAEVQGYLKHCVREAGGNYDAIFDKDVAELVHQSTGGIPRVINNVCEAAMMAAMDKHSSQITAALFAQVAADTLGVQLNKSTENSAEIITEDGVVIDAVTAERPPESAHVEEASYTTIEDLDASNEESEIADVVDTDDVESPSEYTDTKAEIEPASVTRTSTKADIDWDAIAPPPLPRSEIRDLSRALSPKSNLVSTNERKLDIESGNHPNIDEVISAGKSQAEEDSHAEKNTGDRLMESLEAATAEDSPESVVPAMPSLIDDTQPELRELPDISDDPAIAVDLPTLPKAEDTKVEDIPTLVPGPAALDPEKPFEELKEADDDLCDASDFVSLNHDATLPVEAGLANGTPGTAPDSAELEPREPHSLSNVATRSAQLEALEEKFDAPKSAPESVAHNAEIETSTELPTLSDSMRIGISAKESIENKESEITASTLSAGEADAMAVPEFSDVPDSAQESLDKEPMAAIAEKSDSDSVEADWSQSESANTLSSPAPELDAPTTLSANSEDESSKKPDLVAGMFDNLDPLPDLEELDEVHLQNEVATQAGSFTEDDGAIAVTNLTIANNFDKSKNDIDALEAALEAAKQGKISAPSPIEQTFKPELNGDVTTVDISSSDDDDTIDVPQITLDDELEKRKASAVDLEKMAHEIGSADSLEDFSASMAETLFGSEAFDEIAAQVAAKTPVAEGSTEPLSEDEASPVQLEDKNLLSAANDMNEKSATVLSLELEKPEPAIVEPKTAELSTENVADKTASAGPSIDDSIAMRIDILNRAKNNVAGMATENVELGESSLSTTSDGMTSPKPESIENQINTSITQTLEALSVEKIAKIEQEQAEEEEKPKKKSGGLFARFRKSS